MDLNSLRYFFAWREERAQMNPYFWIKHPGNFSLCHWVLNSLWCHFLWQTNPSVWHVETFFVWLYLVCFCFLLCNISFSLFADEKKTSHFALIKAGQHAVAILAAGSSSSSCESTTTVHFTKGWLSVCLPVCVSHMWATVINCFICLSVCESINWRNVHRMGLNAFIHIWI